MGCAVVIGIVVVAFLVALVVASVKEQNKLASLTPEELENLKRRKRQDEEDKERGAKNPAMVCPHCQTKGEVRAKKIQQKKGISGGKATAAVLTAGTSILATGLSRKEEVTQAYCENCHNTWVF